jgi:kinesin family protein 4/21/27
VALEFRQLQRREELGTSLDQLMRRRDHALISRQDRSVIRDLEDQIESMKANIDYIQESIAESQANIMQIEESKVCIRFLFLSFLFLKTF